MFSVALVYLLVFVAQWRADLPRRSLRRLGTPVCLSIPGPWTVRQDLGARVRACSRLPHCLIQRLE